ncbi:MAG: DNA-directed RNA polymerase subunit beta', partial [bacterium]|nr:DNA-directed RNA polymerase subunit beta' [bacterium]
PLTEEAQEECRELMMATHNLLKPANGDPITVPNKEMAMGTYYHTALDGKVPAIKTIFASKDEAYHAFQVGQVALRQAIKVRVQTPTGTQILETTVGRLQFNDILPESLRYINEPVTAKKIKELVTKAIQTEEEELVAVLIDDIKNLGFQAATMSGLSVSVSDCQMIEEKEEIIIKANKQAEEVQDNYNEGLVTTEERRRLTFDIWMKTTDEVAEKTWNSYDEQNAVKVMINSGGTRASKDQVKQLAAMRGLVVDPLGNIVEMPTKSNFREGLSIFEYVTSARGSRKGLTDSALKTADAGYLTRRLCDVSHDVIIRQYDCGTKLGLELFKGNRPDAFANRMTGRMLNKPVLNGKKTIEAGQIVTPELAQEIVAAGTDMVEVRSPLSCESARGLCQACYGWDFSTHAMVDIGVPVGVIAAQSIGEPGTQLTMRVKHSGGIVGLDVTQGLPRVEELVEARVPKNLALVAEISGKVSIEDTDEGTVLTIKTTSQPMEERAYTVPRSSVLVVDKGDLVTMGQALTGGSMDPHELMNVRGLQFAQEHIINEVQKVYESQGIPIHDKHFEVILRKMGDKVQIEQPGDTEFLTGEVTERGSFIQANDATIAAGGEPATAKVMLLGITRSSLFTNSWLSAASFQHTKNVLTEAAASGAVDYLVGLKENVIIGRLIPTSKDQALIEEVA